MVRSSTRYLFGHASRSPTYQVILEVLVALLSMAVVENDGRLVDGRRDVETDVTFPRTDVFVPRQLKLLQKCFFNGIYIK